MDFISDAVHHASPSGGHHAHGGLDHHLLDHSHQPGDLHGREGDGHGPHNTAEEELVDPYLSKHDQHELQTDEEKIHDANAKYEQWKKNKEVKQAKAATKEVTKEVKKGMMKNIRKRGDETVRQRALLLERARSTDESMVALEAKILVASFIATVCMMIATPLPVVLMKKWPHERTLFDTFDSKCFMSKGYYHAAGAFALLGELATIASFLLLVAEMANRQLFTTKLLQKHHAKIVFACAKLLQAASWGHVVHIAYNMECEEDSAKSYGAGFIMIVIAWVVQFLLITVYTYRTRHKQMASHFSNEDDMIPFTVLDKLPGAPSYCGIMSATSSVFSESEHVLEQSPLKGWEGKAETGLFVTQIVTTIFLVIGLPLNMYSYMQYDPEDKKNIEVSLGLFGYAVCEGDKHRMHAAGTFGFLAVFTSFLSIYLVIREFFLGGVTYFSNNFTGVVILLSNFCIMMTWGIVASLYHNTSCDGKDPVNMPDAEYGGILAIFLLCWLLNLLAGVPLYFLRKLKGGVQHMDELYVWLEGEPEAEDQKHDNEMGREHKVHHAISGFERLLHHI